MEKGMYNDAVQASSDDEKDEYMCPECSEMIDVEEYAMFGGKCEDCATGLDY